MFEQIHPEDLPALVRGQEDSAAKMIPFRWEGRRYQDRQLYWTRLESIPTQQPDGMVIWSGIHSDITAQKEAEIELERNRKLLERITHLIPDIVHLYDLPSGEMIYRNRDTSQLLGYTTEDVRAMGRNYLQTLMHPDDYAVEKSFGNRYATIQDNQIIETEYRWRKKTGEILWLNVREVVYERAKDGTVSQIMGVIRDVTDRRSMEENRQQLFMQLQAANQDLNDFAYVISHDLKAPLRGVNSLASWLLSGYADKLDENGKNLLNLLTGRVRRWNR